jgi:hypothetical protein
MKNKQRMIILMTVMFLGTIGCGSYYRIKDPGNQNVYYTEDIEDQDSGAIKFEDANTGSVVTIQNSEVTKISKDEYKKNVINE